MGKILIIGTLLFVFAMLFVGSLSNNQQQAPEPIISKCDSLQLVNNELQFEIQILKDRVSKYETGLEFLKYKDIRTYRFVMNAGNLEFNDRL